MGTYVIHDKESDEYDDKCNIYGRACNLYSKHVERNIKILVYVTNQSTDRVTYL